MRYHLPRTRRGRMVFWLSYWFGMPALVAGTAYVLYLAYLWKILPQL
jgi:hypothetical protein